jgi:hypothetical protein
MAGVIGACGSEGLLGGVPFHPLDGGFVTGKRTFAGIEIKRTMVFSMRTGVSTSATIFSTILSTGTLTFSMRTTFRRKRAMYARSAHASFDELCFGQ